MSNVPTLVPTSAVNLQGMTQLMMQEMVKVYSDKPEFKTIMMNLTTVSRELNAIRVKEIYNPTDEPA